MSILYSLLLAAKVTFGSPVNQPIALAGNFGEPRPNHFHGGIDVKTGGREGWPIFAIGDGYISRVSVGVGGFGNAVYVHHPEGYTSVYCHLKAFTPAIKARVRRWQYAHQRGVGEMRFAPTDLPVARGQLIAISGNTGASQAPHLHLEVHETRTGDQIDPLRFIAREVEDRLPPMAHGFMAYPKAGEGVFNGGSAKQSVGFSSHHLQRPLMAWGKVGFALWANDYMEATYNRYGVKRTELRVDGHSIFSSTVERIPNGQTVQVNAWGDEEHFRRMGVWYLRSFVPPGLTLPFFTTNAEAGYVDFKEERNYRLEYLLTDFKGNTSQYSFIVTARPTKIPLPRPKSILRTVCWNRPSAFLLPGAQLWVRQGSVAEDVELAPRILLTDSRLSHSYTFATSPLRLFHPAGIRLRVDRHVARPEKLYIVAHGSVDRYIGGTYQDGWLTAHVRDLHLTYEVDYDDRPPVISPIGQSHWAASGTIRLGLEDTKSGLAEYKGSLDGEFVLFEDVPKSPWVVCRLKDTPLQPTGKLRHLRFTATDRCGNTRTFETQILY